MALKKKKISTRRQHVRENISPERFSRLSLFANSPLPWALLILIVFVGVVTAMLSFNLLPEKQGQAGLWKPWRDVVALSCIVTLVCMGGSLYVYHYQSRIIHRPTRTIALAGLFVVLLALTRIGSLDPAWKYFATGSAVTCAMILTIAYNQRFAMGMTLFYCVLACFGIGKAASIELYQLFLTMMVGVVTCCFSLREIRTRMKLIEVATIASVAVFVAAATLGVLQHDGVVYLLGNAGKAAAITVAVGVVIQGFLPIIEKIFGIATSMTLMDYSDANQPLLKKLAMGAPGTFSHSLLIGSISETAAEAIGANGLLCRVGAYYHDIGKINKPAYFIENQMGSVSRHEQLSPAMSQLVIVGHIKDGIEIAKEFGLPSVLRQFIETHHGTTLIEYFYHEAKKQQDEKQSLVSETEFRYPGPKPRTKESAIVMLADTVEGAVRSATELTPTRIEVIVHNMAMKRLQDGQFDECDLTLRELSQIEAAISKSLAAHHHGRIAYPQMPGKSVEKVKNENHDNTSEKSA